MSTEHDFHLIELYLSGRASAEAVKALEARLGADAELRQEFLRYAHVDAALKTMVRPFAQQLLATLKVKTPLWNIQVIRWVAAAVFALAGVLALWMPRGVEVRVMASSDNAASVWKNNNTLRLREVVLDQGRVELRLVSGVLLDIAAPAHLRLHDSMHVTLLAGSVTADVGDEGKGFVIDTASARVVDLGTRFGVSLGQEGETDVAVFQGEVEVYGPGQRKKVATLHTGDAVRVHSSATVRRLVCINTRGDAFAAIARPPADALVTSITDNVDDGGNYAFYTLQSGQMHAGARPYSTLGRPRWHPLPGEAFPRELIGADIVGTFSPDRNDPDLELTLGVSRPCTVYLMLDERAEVPEWVRRDFVEAGFQLRSGPWSDNPVVQGMTADENGEIHLNYQVWKRTVPSAGAVKLGAPYPDKGGRYRAMYGIAVK